MTPDKTPSEAPLSVIELMKVVMQADEETRAFALRGTTNWSAHIGKAVQKAVLAKWGSPAQAAEPFCWQWENTFNGGTGAVKKNPETLGINMSHPDYKWTALYTAPQPTHAQAASSAVLKAIREANMQLVRTGDDAFMLLPYLQAHVQNPAEIEHVAGDVSKSERESNMTAQPGQEGELLQLAKAYKEYIDALPADVVAAQPATADAVKRRELVTNWFAENWAIEKAFGLLDDYDAAATPAAVAVPDEIDRLRAALVYVAFALHGTRQYMLAEGVTLIDGDTVRVSRDGWTVEASSNPLRQPEPQPSPAAQGDALDAARYRWLRRWKGQEHEPPFTVQHEIDGALWGGDLDAAIDADRKQGTNHD